LQRLDASAARKNLNFYIDTLASFFVKALSSKIQLHPETLKNYTNKRNPNNNLCLTNDKSYENTNEI
jgi:hypothetical protein